MKFNRHKVTDVNGNHKFTIMTNTGNKIFTPTLHIDGICVSISRKDAVSALRDARNIGYTIKSEFAV